MTEGAHAPSAAPPVANPATPVSEGRVKRRRRRQGPRAKGALLAADPLAACLPPRGSDDFYRALVEYNVFIARFAEDESFRSSTIRQWSTWLQRGRTDTASSEFKLEANSSGYEHFDPRWLWFLDDPELTDFGAFVWKRAKQDEVIHGLWKDIVFANDSKLVRQMGRRGLLEYSLRVAAGETPRVWMAASRDDAVVLLYLYLYPLGLKEPPALTQEGSYAEIRAQYEDRIADVREGGDANRATSELVQLCLGWELGVNKISTYGRQAVKAAIERGHLRLEPRGIASTRAWIDPRTDPSPEAEANRARWTSASKQSSPRSAKPGA